MELLLQYLSTREHWQVPFFHINTSVSLKGLIFNYTLIVSSLQMFINSNVKHICVTASPIMSSYIIYSFFKFILIDSTNTES